MSILNFGDPSRRSVIATRFLFVLALAAGAAVAPAAWSTTSPLLLESVTGQVDAAPNFANAYSVTDGDGGLLVFWTHASENVATPPFEANLVSGRHISRDGDVLWSYETSSPLPFRPLSGAVPDGDGGAIYVAGSTAYRVSADGAPLWGSAGVELTTGAPVLRFVSDEAGGGIAVWQGSDNRFYAQRISPEGLLLWPDGSAGVALTTFPEAANPSNDWDAAGDGAGGLLFAWSVLGRSDFYVQHVAPSGEPQWDGIWIGDDAHIRNPKIRADPAGGAFISWLYDDDGLPGNSGALKVHRVSAAAAPLWTSATTVVPDISDYQVAAYPAGGLVFSWAETTGVLSQRVDAAGAVAWASPAVVVTNPPILETNITAGFDIGPIQPDDQGNAIISWHLKVNVGHPADYDYLPRLQKVGADGQVLWAQFGVALHEPTQSGAPTGQFGRITQLHPDGAGGANVLLVRHATNVGIPYLFAVAAAHVSHLGHLGPHDASTGYHSRQDLRIAADWEGYQVLTFRYTNGETWISPYQAGPGTVAVDLLRDEWVGSFLYDYEQGRYSDAHYGFGDRLN